jgi:hypothetical protein
MGRSKPNPRLAKVSFEELKGEADQPREPHQPIRLIRLKPLGFLPTGQGPGWDLKQFRNPRKGEI